MTLKAIELQVALPRTHDAGKIQEQMQQRGQQLQDHAAQRVTKEENLKRKTVIKNEQKQEARLNKEDGSEQKNGSQNEQHSKKKSTKSEGEPHPYKGKVIDYSG